MVLLHYRIARPWGVPLLQPALYGARALYGATNHTDDLQGRGCGVSYGALNQEGHSVSACVDFPIEGPLTLLRRGSLVLFQLDEQGFANQLGVHEGSESFTHYLKFSTGTPVSYLPREYACFTGHRLPANWFSVRLP